MKAFQKLAIASAIALTSISAFAMEAADDETLAAATGQDGITILVAPGYRSAAQLTGLGVSAATQTTIDVGGTAGRFAGLSILQTKIHDNDTTGALVIGNGGAADATVIFADDVTPIVVNVDMIGDADGVTAGNQAQLAVSISTPTLGIKTGSISVAHSNGAANGVVGHAATTATSTDTPIKILNGMEIVLSPLTLNVQLGTESQTLFGGAASAVNPTVMVSINANLAAGLTINNTDILDAGGAVTGGAIHMGSTKITNNGAANLNMIAGVDVDDGTLFGSGGGLVITLGQLGSAAVGADIVLTDVRLGKVVYLGSGAIDNALSVASLGDVEMVGLNMAGSHLVIRGH